VLIDLKCPLSYNADKSCYFAIQGKDGIKCSQVIGWYHDQYIKHHEHCFVRLRAREKLRWRNRMIKKNGPAKI
jgi:hypothetical protein